MSSSSAPPIPAQLPPLLAGDELGRLIRSRFSVVYLGTSEEARAEGIIAGAAQACGRRLWTWSISDGLRAPGQPGVDTNTVAPVAALRHISQLPGDDVFILRDMARHAAEDPTVERLIRDVARDSEATLILLGPHAAIPEGLRMSVATYDLPRPDQALIDAHVRAQLAHAARAFGVQRALDETGMALLASSLRGLTLEQVDQVLLNLLHDDGVLDTADIPRAVEEKGRLLAATGVLTLETPTHGLEWVAGFPHLKAWIAGRTKAFQPDAVAFGLTPPRGLLLTGVPGCGKSFVAKAIACTWGMPLLRLDAGSLFDSFIGASERNLREALATAEALAPSILWIDEIEKGFGSRGPSESDGGLSYRMLGTLATWMQDRTAPVFLLATSNDTTKLPPELTRQGRFDETFFVDLPDDLAREHLYRLQLARVGRHHEQFDCAALAAAAAGFSGAEIEQSMVNALYTAFGAGREVTTADILGEIQATRPLSEVSPAAIAGIRDWGEHHARPC
jgi:hypothetical protein